MKSLIFLALFPLLIAGNANAAPLSGNELLRVNEDIQLGYVIGFWEGANLGVLYAKLKGINLDELSTCTDKWTRFQFEAIVKQYLRNNPQRWDEPMYTLIIDALQDSCRKKKR
ncbi:MAG: hypothetical protein Q8M54_03720 [Desulfobaccales bacterium]|nr:hypothetical protein [Desulfobaccales bacterium]